MYWLSKYGDAVAVDDDDSSQLQLHDYEWLFVKEVIAVEGEGNQRTSWKAWFLHGPVFAVDWRHELAQC
jgi:hypothetical protein